MQAQETVQVLALREDLRLFASAPETDGSPTWVIQDPVVNRFYRIGWVEYECLRRWPNPPEIIAKAVSFQTPLTITAETVQEFGQFLEQHHLVHPSAEGLARLKEQTAKAPSWRQWRWWLRNYLFIRVPLVRPERFLQRLLPWVEPLFSRTALWLLVAMTVIGLFLVMRQWDIFTHSVVDLISPAGLLGFAIALTVSKTLHELGHALVATRQGVRVAHMGVAFLVMWPMLYTDTGESWRLRSHRQRLAISIAGVSVEMALAGIATFVWALLPDGVMRDAMLYLATTAWILSLALNVSPFMRFDGYFILSDILGFPNLHERAGAMAKSRLRRFVLGLTDSDPEVMKPAAARALTWFAFATWLYRLGVFLAIAWVVYTLFFKILGIILLVVEIAWFVLRPIWTELMVWKKRWPEVKAKRRFLLYAIGMVLLAFLIVPWSFKVDAPGVARSEREQFVYAPFAAQLSVIEPKGVVQQGALLAAFQSPDLVAKQERIQSAVHALEQRLAGIMADTRGSVLKQATLQRFYEQQAELVAIAEETQRLNIKAEFEGLWIDVDPLLQIGTWVDAQTLLGVLIDPQRWVVDAYIEQQDIERIQTGAAARFYLAGQNKSIAAHVIFIDTSRTQRPLSQLLDARYGGEIMTQEQESAVGIPLRAHYRVRLQLEQPLGTQQELKGMAYIEGERRSLLWEWTKGVITILIRESGF